MRVTVIVAVLIVGLSFTAKSQDWYYMDLVTQIRYQRIRDPMATHHYSSKHYKEESVSYKKYDIKGHLIESGEYGEQYCEKHYATKAERKRADSTGEIIPFLYYCSHFDKLKSVSTYTLDSTGKILSEEVFKYHNNVKAKLLNYYLYIYDGKGRLVQKDRYDADSSLSGTSRWDYDSEGNCTYKSDSSYGRQEIAISSQFNDHRQCISQTIVSPVEGKQIEKHYYTGHNELILMYKGIVDNLGYMKQINRNFLGQPMEEKQWDMSWGDTKIEYVYNNLDLLKEKNTYEKGDLSLVNKYKYIRNRKHGH